MVINSTAAAAAAAVIVVVEVIHFMLIFVEYSALIYLVSM